MAGKYGVEEVIRVSNAAFDLGEGVEAMIKVLSAPGNILSKLKIVNILLDMSPAIMVMSSINKEQLVNEAKEMDAEDKAKLLASIKSNFDLSNDSLESGIEEILSVVVEASDVVQKAIDKAPEWVRRVLAVFKKPA